MKTDRIVMRKSEYLDDWYVIINAEHDGREWLEHTGLNSVALQLSERISDACVEGTLEEMHGIAMAIHARNTARFKRCAVQYVNDVIHGQYFEFWSPRNSQRCAEVPVHHADELAAEIVNYIRNLNRSV